MNGAGGNDTLFGLSGSDTLPGGAGDESGMARSTRIGLPAGPDATR